MGGRGGWGGGRGSLRGMPDWLGTTNIASRLVVSRSVASPAGLPLLVTTRNVLVEVAIRQTTVFYVRQKCFTFKSHTRHSIHTYIICKGSLSTVPIHALLYSHIHINA